METNDEELPTLWDVVIRDWKNGTISDEEAMTTLNLKRTTFYKLVANEK